MSDDDDKLPAHQGGVAGVGGNPTVPQPPAKPITDEVLGREADRDCERELAGLRSAFTKCA